jgi:drug/metabolite transporter (DMT)-like permease
LKKEERMKMEWFVYALVSLVSFGILFTLIKYGLNKGITSEGMLFYQFLFTALIIGAVLLFSSKNSFSINKIQLLVLIIIGIISVIANLFLFKAMTISTNPGYVLAITNLNTLLVLIASFFVFGAKFDAIKIAGTVLAVIGVILIGWK